MHAHNLTARESGLWTGRPNLWPVSDVVPRIDNVGDEEGKQRISSRPPAGSPHLPEDRRPTPGYEAEQARAAAEAGRAAAFRVQARPGEPMTALARRRAQAAGEAAAACIVRQPNEYAHVAIVRSAQARAKAELLGIGITQLNSSSGEGGAS